MTAPRHQLADDRLLTTDEALAYLAERGIHTSRSGLDEAFKSGRLSRVKVRGRVRILYRPRDLLAAFIIGEDFGFPRQINGMTLQLGRIRPTADQCVTGRVSNSAATEAQR